MTIEQMRAERTRLIESARVISDSPRSTADDAVRGSQMLTDAESLRARIDARQRLAEQEATVSDHRRQNAALRGVSVDRIESDVATERRLIRALVVGVAHCRPEDAAELQRRFSVVQNAASTGSSTGGGYAIAPQYMAELLIAMRLQGSMRAVAHQVSTTTGAPLAWPMLDDRSQSARLVANENVLLPAATDAPFSSGTLTAYNFLTDVLLVSNQLERDSAFDFDMLIQNALAGRLVRGQNPYFTTGTGTGQPLGVVTGAALGVTGATGSTVSATVDNLLDLVHSIDPVYRPGARFMFHDTTLQMLRKLKDASGRYIVQTGATGQAEDTVLGYPVTINQDMPVMAANTKSMLFGSFESYVIRDVMDFRMITLRERYADVNQTGLVGVMRSDGRLLSAAQPIKYYQNSAT